MTNVVKSPGEIILSTYSCRERAMSPRLSRSFAFLAVVDLAAFSQRVHIYVHVSCKHQKFRARVYQCGVDSESLGYPKFCTLHDMLRFRKEAPTG